MSQTWQTQSFGNLSQLWLSCLGPLLYLLPKTLKLLGSSVLTMNVPDGYYRNVSCTLNSVSTFVFPIDLNTD